MASPRVVLAAFSNSQPIDFHIAIRISRFEKEKMGRCYRSWISCADHYGILPGILYNFNAMGNTFRFTIALLLSLASVCSFGQSNHDTLFVFVGRKLSIQKQPIPRPPLSDSMILFSYENYKARYEIIQELYGDFKGKEIEFGVDDHFGLPDFSKSEYALLFVYQRNGKLHHVKYQYFDVYKTTNGRWASCGDPFNFDEKFKDSIKTPIQVVKLDFPRPVTFIINRSKDSLTISNVFPVPYFKVEGQVATGLMGCYVEDLFVVKKEGILKQLGYF
jgi:hypothetical protein